MRTIFEYEQFQLDFHDVMLPGGAKFLYWGVPPKSQYFGPLSAWFEVDTEAKPESRKFIIFATGDVIPVDTTEYQFVYLATVTKSLNVFHLYEQVATREEI